MAQSSELTPGSGKPVGGGVWPAPGPYYGPMPEAGSDGNDSGTEFDIRRIVRKNWPFLFLFLILGGLAGVASVVISSPVYNSRLIVLVQDDADPLRRGNERSTFAEDTNIQTLLFILRSGSFLQRGVQRLQAETVPLAPAGSDIFARLRQRVRPATKDPMESFRQGVSTAVGSFTARPITGTKLIEMSCDSTVPDIASQFLNVMAAEFVEETGRNRMQTSQKTNEWLAAQIEDTKAKVQEAEERLQTFVRASGNMYAGQDVTLDDSKLVQLKGELTKIQAERIAKQTRLELAQKASDEVLPDVLSDSKLLLARDQLVTLRRQKAVLDASYTADHYKVRKIASEIELLQNSFAAEIQSARKRVQSEFETARRQESSLSAAYAGQAQRVGAQAGKAAEYNSLKREVETLRQMYQGLLAQANQTGLSSSAPVMPIRILETAHRPEVPYKPRPILSIGFGLIAGLALTAGLAFVRERTDKSVTSVTSARVLLNATELGVIPSALRSRSKGGLFARKTPLQLGGKQDVAADSLSSPASWNEQPIVAEYFRSALASLLRNASRGTAPRAVLVTSPAPGDGKTTVASNIGMAIAETGRRVLLVDGDFRRPRLHHNFQISNDKSLLDLLQCEGTASAADWEAAVAPTVVPNLFVLPNRPTNENVSKALHSPDLRHIMEWARRTYDMVIVDAPPILYLADARVIAPLTDGLILVMRSGVTSRNDVLDSYQRIREDGLVLFGAILNDWNPGSDHFRYHYDAYSASREGV